MHARSWRFRCLGASLSTVRRLVPQFQSRRQHPYFGIALAVDLNRGWSCRLPPACADGKRPPSALGKLSRFQTPVNVIDGLCTLLEPPGYLDAGFHPKVSPSCRLPTNRPSVIFVVELVYVTQCFKLNAAGRAARVARPVPGLEVPGRVGADALDGAGVDGGPDTFQPPSMAAKLLSPSATTLPATTSRTPPKSASRWCRWRRMLVKDAGVIRLAGYHVRPWRRSRSRRP